MFFDNLKSICAQRGISVYKACADIGLSRASINKWRNGAQPNSTTITKFANYFDVSPSCFFDDSVEPVFYDKFKQLCESSGFELSDDERQLISAYRDLSEQGREYIRQTLQMAALMYKKSDRLPNVADVG